MEREIRVNCYDGGGIEVTVQNYRPVSLHLRVLDQDCAATTVADAVRGLVLEWIAEQHQEKKTPWVPW